MYGETDSTVGILGTNTALTMTRVGSSYITILKNAYSYSNNAANEVVSAVSY